MTDDARAQLRALAAQFRRMADKCIPDGEGAQAFMLCAENVEVAASLLVDPAGATPSETEQQIAEPTDDQLREMWRSVQGPYAELNGPLIRYAHLVSAQVKANCESRLRWVRVQRDTAEERLSESPKRAANVEQVRQWLEDPRGHRCGWTDQAADLLTALEAADQQIADVKKRLLESWKGADANVVECESVADLAAYIVAGGWRLRKQCDKLSQQIADRDELSQQIADLTREIQEERAVCICGCPNDAHENYGEDGESCEHDDHECLRVCAGAAAIVTKLRQRLAVLEAALQEALDEWAYASEYKGDHLAKKHNDAHRIGELRALLAPSSPADKEQP